MKMRNWFLSVPVILAGVGLSVSGEDKPKPKLNLDSILPGPELPKLVAPSFGDKKPYGSKSTGGYAGKSSGYAGGSERTYPNKKPFNVTGSAKSTGRTFSSTGKPAGTFDKFKGNAKPFGKRPPARKYKPREGEGA